MGFGGRGVSYRYVFDVFCVLGSWFGVLLLVSSCLTPPLSAEAGLGNQAAPLWHRRRLLSFGPGLGWFLRIPSCRHCPRSVPGCGLGSRATQLRHRTVDFSFFSVLFSSCRSPAPPRSEPGAIWVFWLLWLWHRTV